MRYLLYFILVFVASAAAFFAIIGIPGHLSRKPPLEVFPDMDRQAKLRPEKPFDFFTNGLSSQLPPAGTVVRSAPVETANGEVYSYQGVSFNTGRITGTTNFVAISPMPVDAVLLGRGREQFNIYCTPCHGGLGDGNGITKKIGVMPAVANLHDKRIVEMTDGEIFNTITHGKGLMGAYGTTVAAQDRWAIIAYTRALQLSWLGSTNELTVEQRAALKK
jgi:mono/diheme cytochrome c family protein